MTGLPVGASQTRAVWSPAGGDDASAVWAERCRGDVAAMPEGGGVAACRCAPVGDPLREKTTVFAGIRERLRARLHRGVRRADEM